MLKIALFSGVTMALTLLGLSLKRMMSGSNRSPAPPTTPATPGAPPSPQPLHQELWGKMKESGRSHAGEIIASLVALVAALIFLRAGSRSLYGALVGSASFWFLIFVMVFVSVTSSIESESMKGVKKFVIALLVVCAVFEWFHLIPDTARHWGEKRVLLTPDGTHCVYVNIPPYYHLEWQMNIDKASANEPVKDGSNLVWTACIRPGADSVWVTTRVREGLAPE